MEFALGTDRGFAFYDKVAGLAVEGRFWVERERAEFFLSRLPSEIGDRLMIVPVTRYILADDGDVA